MEIQFSELCFEICLVNSFFKNRMPVANSPESARTYSPQYNEINEIIEQSWEFDSAYLMYFSVRKKLDERRKHGHI